MKLLCRDFFLQQPLRRSFTKEFPCLFIHGGKPGHYRSHRSCLCAELMDSTLTVREFSLLTWQTTEASLEVTFQVVIAGLGLIKHDIGNTDLTLLSGWAFALGNRKNVGIATDEAKVGLDAASQTHSAVEGAFHHDHLTIRATGLEYLVVTVFAGAWFWKRKNATLGYFDWINR